MRLLLMILSSLLACTFATAQTAPQFISVTPNSSTLLLDDLFELDITLQTAATNLHDYDEILLKAEFYAPSGQTISIEAFYYQHFIPSENGLLLPAGDPFWKIRFTPTESGNWQYKLFVEDPFGTDSTEIASFFCQPSAATGFVRSQPFNPYLINDAGQSVFLLGENLGWANQPDGSDKMGYYLQQLHAHEMNFAKLIMTPWAYQIEWTEGGLRNYFPRQSNTFLLDSIFRMANELDIYLMLTFSIHTELNNGFAGEDWSSNPYNSANGGMCNNPWEFFSHPDAKAAFKNRIRYLLARYSWSTNLVSWGLLAEADNFPWYKQHSNSIAAWCNEMADFLNEHDPNNHLVSAGFALSTSNPDVWNHPTIDFSQLHMYAKSQDIEGDVFRQIGLFRENFQIPMLVGEFGLGHFPDSLIHWDPQGISLKNSLWTSFMAGAMGSVVPWFWDHYIDTMNLYPLYTPLARFLFNEPLHQENHQAVHLFSESDTQQTAMIFPDFDDLTQKAPSRSFNLHKTGQMVPAADSMGQFLFGPLSLFASLRNPPEITAYWNSPSILELETGVQATAAVLQISVDGMVVFEQTAAAASVYQIEVPAGLHTIKIDNIGSGFFSILELHHLSFHDFLPEVRGFGSIADNHAWAWLHNRNHHWKYLLDHGTLPPPASATVLLPLQPGIYSIDWFNTDFGRIDSTSQHLSSENGLLLQISNLQSDLALKAAMLTPIRQPIASLPEMVVYPNPFNDGVSFAFELPQADVAMLRIFDTKGRLIYENTTQYHRAGVTKISWDGQTQSGQKVLPGLYSYQLRIGNNKIHQGKIVRF